MIRAFREGDRADLHRLFAQFNDEVPPPSYHSDSLEKELREVDVLIEQGVAYVAEEDGGLAGFVIAKLRGLSEGYVCELFVDHDHRGRGIGKELLRMVAEWLRERGATHVTLNVDVGNANARAFYDHLGFTTNSLHLETPVEALLERAAARPREASFGSVHVQTDDRTAVERAVTAFLPRLGRSAGTTVSDPRNGWISVYDELCDRDPQALRRLARELSDRMGAVTLAIGLEEGVVVRYVLFDRGRVADEYASVPEYFGPLPPGDVVAMRANPTVAARLTGADPARVRAAAPTASSPSDLPPPRELLASVAGALGIEGATYGWVESSA